MKTTINTTDINNSNELSHVSKLTGRTYQIGSLVCPITGKHFDVTVVTDFHNDIEDSNFEIVTFYFGDYDYDTTEAYIKLAGGVPQKKPSLERYCQDALNILCDTQALDSSMPIEWSNYCETAQCIDPNGDWTDVAYTPDNLQALIDFYINQIKELEGILLDDEPSTEDATLIQECYATFIDIDDIEPDAEYGAELTTVDVKSTAPDKSYELQRYIVLTQNIAGCRTPSEGDGEIIHTVEISAAEYRLLCAAARYAIQQTRESNGDINALSEDEVWASSNEDLLAYADALEEAIQRIEAATVTDSTDIQIRY